jgi:hypothetical protein
MEKSFKTWSGKRHGFLLTNSLFSSKAEADDSLPAYDLNSPGSSAFQKALAFTAYDTTMSRNKARGAVTL